MVACLPCCSRAVSDLGPAGSQETKVLGTKVTRSRHSGLRTRCTHTNKHTHTQERFQHIKSALEPFLHSLCGFRPTSVQWLPAVGPSGQNLVVPPTEAALAAWWQGPTLVQAVDGFKPRERLTGDLRCKDKPSMGGDLRGKDKPAMGAPGTARVPHGCSGLHVPPVSSSSQMT